MNWREFGGVHLEILSEQSLRLRLDLASALLNSILDFCSGERLEVLVELCSSKVDWRGFENAASFSPWPPLSIAEDEEKTASVFVVEVGGGGEDTRLRRFAAGCLNRSIIVFDEDAAMFFFFSNFCASKFCLLNLLLPGGRLLFYGGKNERLTRRTWSRSRSRTHYAVLPNSFVLKSTMFTSKWNF